MVSQCSFEYPTASVPCSPPGTTGSSLRQQLMHYNMVNADLALGLSAATSQLQVSRRCPLAELCGVESTRTSTHRRQCAVQAVESSQIDEFRWYQMTLREQSHAHQVMELEFMQKYFGDTHSGSHHDPKSTEAQAEDTSTETSAPKPSKAYRTGPTSPTVLVQKRPIHRSNPSKYREVASPSLMSSGILVLLDFYDNVALVEDHDDVDIDGFQEPHGRPKHPVSKFTRETYYMYHCFHYRKGFIKFELPEMGQYFMKSKVFF
ncbi:hypothetical protein V8E54_010384 [Elaphomyces granulatus]